MSGYVDKKIIWGQGLLGLQLPFSPSVEFECVTW